MRSTFAQAPVSLVGKVFHETVFAIRSRESWSRITELKADGNTIAIKSAMGHALTLQAPYDFFLTSPRIGVTYQYTVTGSNTATLSFRDMRGESTYGLTFTSPNAGSIGLGSDPAAGTFSLSDSAALSAAPASNVSLRGSVASDRPLIVGFVVPGSESRDVLIRAVGPSLSQFGMTGLWSDPDFELFRGGARAVRRDIHYRDWSSTAPYESQNISSPAAGFRNLFSYVGAFPLLSDSKDAAEMVRLDPGAYTIVAEPSAGDSGGAVIIEVYFMP